MEEQPDLGFLDGKGKSTRRDALKAAGATGLVLATGAFLAACGSGANVGSAGTVAPTGPRKPGGTLTVGVGGGTAKDIADPHNALSEAVYPRIFNLFDLGGYRNNRTFDQEYRLFESAEPNKAGDRWDVRLRADVEFHNGKTLSAEDLIFTVNRILSKASPTVSAPSVSFIGLKSMKAMDKRTVRFNLEKPVGIFLDAFFQPYASIVPVGFDPKNPIGTGPFRFESYRGGQRSVFKRFENYWDKPAYVEELVILDFVEDSARVNALLGGQVDAIEAVPASQIPVVEGSSAILVASETGDWRPFTMRMDQPPFDDVRVRQAMRLIADRQQILDAAYGGKGRLANDVFSPYGNPYAEHLPQREQDLEQAKSLLKQAGQEGLSVELITSPIAGGLVEAAQVFAEQAKGANVNVKVTLHDPDTFFGQDYTQVPFGVDFWPTYPYLSNAAQAVAPGAPFNTTHPHDPEYNALFAEATATLDEKKRNSLIEELQRIDYERGGYLVYGFVDTVDAYSSKLTGYETDKNGWGLNSYAFRKLSFT